MPIAVGRAPGEQLGSASAAWNDDHAAAVERAAAARARVPEQLGLQRPVDDVRDPQARAQQLRRAAACRGAASMPTGVALTRPSASRQSPARSPGRRPRPVGRELRAQGGGEPLGARGSTSSTVSRSRAQRAAARGRRPRPRRRRRAARRADAARRAARGRTRLPKPERVGVVPDRPAVGEHDGVDRAERRGVGGQRVEMPAPPSACTGG